jgi:hypothetical protein
LSIRSSDWLSGLDRKPVPDRHCRAYACDERVPTPARPRRRLLETASDSRSRLLGAVSAGLGASAPVTIVARTPERYSCGLCSSAPQLGGDGHAGATTYASSAGRWPCGLPAGIPGPAAHTPLAAGPPAHPHMDLSVWLSLLASHRESRPVACDALSRRRRCESAPRQCRRRARLGFGLLRVLRSASAPGRCQQRRTLG